MRYLELLNPPPIPRLSWDETAGLIAMTYGENLEDTTEVKKIVLDRIAEQSPFRAIFFGQLERLENVVERVRSGLNPLPTPYWDELMNLCQK